MFGIASLKAFDPWNVYVCSQPSESSIYGLITMLHPSGDDLLDVIWVNLREEPSVYMNGEPFVLRKAEDPFNSLFYQESIVTKWKQWNNLRHRSKVENMEARLKKDIMNELRVVQNCGNVVVSNEVISHQVGELSSFHSRCPSV